MAPILSRSQINTEKYSHVSCSERMTYVVIKTTFFLKQNSVVK